MYSKRSTAIFFFTSTIFGLSAVYLLYPDSTHLTLGEPQTIGLGSPQHPKEQLRVTYQGVSTHYSMLSQYDYVWPHVQVHCNCTCMGDWHIKTCDSNVIDECVEHNNGTTACQYFEDSSKNLDVCPMRQSACCLIYFSRQKKGQDEKVFTGVRLQNAYNSYTVDVSLQKNHQTEDLSYKIHESISSVMILPKVKLRFEYSEPQVKLQDMWYYIERGEQDLFMENLNTNSEQDFRKMGWFKVSSKNAVEPLSRDSVKNGFSVKYSNCTSSVYDWELNAINYYKNGILVNPTSNKRSVKQDVEDISGIRIDWDNQKISLKKKVSESLKVHIDEMNNQVRPSLYFSAAISTYTNGTSFLRLQLNDGLAGRYQVDLEILGGQSFVIFVNTDPTFPMELSFLLRETIRRPKWVCIRMVDPPQPDVLTCDWPSLSEVSHQQETLQATPESTDIIPDNPTMKTRRSDNDNPAKESKGNLSGSKNNDAILHVVVAILVVALIILAVILYMAYWQSSHNQKVYNGVSYERPLHTVETHCESQQ